MDPVLIGSVIDGKAVSDDDASLPLLSPYCDPARDTNDSTNTLTAPGYSHEQAWKRLISCGVPRDELPPLIETIFSERKTTNIVDHLQGNDAQAFIDVIDEVRCHSLRFLEVN